MLCDKHSVIRLALATLTATVVAQLHTHEVRPRGWTREREAFISKKCDSRLVNTLLGPHIISYAPGKHIIPRPAVRTAPILAE